MISDRFQSVAGRFADSVAIREGAVETSYGELNRAANRVAHRLFEETGDQTAPIAVLADGFLQTVAAVHGVWKAGRRLLLLDRYQPQARLQAILDHAGALIILSSGEALAQASAFDRITVDLDRLEDREGQNPSRTSDRDSISAIVYTSGSTGRPKGVIHNHSTLLHVADYWIEQFGLGPDDRALFVGNPGHVAALGDIVRFTVAGTTVVPFRVQASNLKRLAEQITAERITVMHAVPSIFRALCENLDADHDFSSMRLMQVGGEPLLRTDVVGFRRHFPAGCRLVNNLGSTEAPATMQYVVDRDREFEDAVVPVGLPGPGKRIRLVDEQGCEVPDGEIGNLLIEGRVISRGYYNDPELTERFFSGDLTGDGPREFRSGDLGRRDADGLITVLGRADDRIKVRGYRVEPAEVEVALREILEGSRAVSDLAVIAVGSAPDVRLMAYLGRRPGTTLDPQELRVALSERLPSAMQPHDLVMLERLPRTATGKIDRQALPTCVADAGEKSQPVRTSRTMEELALLWSQLLGCGEPAADDDFFALGGDSLKALELIHSIERIFGQSVTLPELMQDSTLSALTARVEAARANRAQPCLVRLSSGEGLPLHLIHGMGGSVVLFQGLARQLVGRTVFAYQARGVDGISRPLESVESMAEAYLTELRRAQPSGPYLLAGYSMGGVVALEMARRLREAGEPIAALIPIDSPAPLPLGFADRWRLGWLIPRLVLNHIRGGDSADGKRNAYVRGLNRLPRINLRALRRYRGSGYDGSIDLISSFDLRGAPPIPPPRGAAEQLAELQRRKRLLWRQIAGERLRVHQVEGHHLDLLSGDSLQQVVRAMQGILLSADPDVNPAERVMPEPTLV